MNNVKLLSSSLAVERLVAVIWTSDADAAVRRGREVYDVGAGVIEVAWTTPNATDAIRELTHLPVWVGAGTITTRPEAEEAIGSGAQFLVAPNFSIEVANTARAHGVPYIPGVFTPIEVASAITAGCSVLKLFPAASGGVVHLKALKEPFPRVQWVPTGGITWDTVGDWLQAGALAIGMGSALFHTVDLSGRIANLRRGHA